MSRLGLPEMADGEESGYLTFNELVRILDAIVNPVVQSAALTAPPGSPVAGECWYVAAGGTGDWLGQDLTLAQWYGSPGAWYFHTLPTGTYVYDEATATRYYVAADGTLSPA